MKDFAFTVMFMVYLLTSIPLILLEQFGWPILTKESRWVRLGLWLVDGCEYEDDFDNDGF